jgi:hypothetical protein
VRRLLLGKSRLPWKLETARCVWSRLLPYGGSGRLNAPLWLGLLQLPFDSDSIGRVELAMPTLRADQRAMLCATLADRLVISVERVLVLRLVPQPSNGTVIVEFTISDDLMRFPTEPAAVTVPHAVMPFGHRLPC